jgi:enterochelin esterase-like enzyme
MKLDLVILSSAVSLFGAGLLPLAAQTPAPPPGNPALVRPQSTPPQASPVVESNRMVTFSLRAPQARQVVVKGQWPDGRVEMTKDTNGVWSATVGPIEPGVWEYGFDVDGLGVIDPGNPQIKPQRRPVVSILQVRGDPARFWDAQDVPRGTVHIHSYRSKSLNRDREVTVYTPPNYERKWFTRYPVLYLQHGSGDNDRTWTVHGKEDCILDNLIARRMAKPMIVVMMDGHTVLPGDGRGGSGRDENTELFERDLLEDVIPLVERTYHVKHGAANRAIVGLSMGGGQSLAIGLNHTDEFAWVGAFSASPPSNEAIGSALSHPDVTNKRLKLLYIAIGKDDSRLDRNKRFVASLDEHGIRHEWRLTEGNHSWPVWRDYLIDFAPKLFR